MTGTHTYPGTVTPLHGLLPFAESDRDVFFGRDTERDELTRLVVGAGFRAGLLFGESGVGKTSLLRAGLLPHLRDQGVFTLLCDDLKDPVRSFANALLAETGVSAKADEKPLEYLARVVSEALEGQLYVFIVDGLERVLDVSGEILSVYAELYARVVSRSGGRARFLFSCSAKKVYALGALERKTGSLFPPSNRFELQRFPVETASMVLERTIALAGLNCSPQMAESLAKALSSQGRVLSADMQIAALAIRDLGLQNPSQLEEIGGQRDLLRAWLLNAAQNTGDERAALRIIGELARGDGLEPRSPDWLTARASVEETFVRHALGSLQANVVVQSQIVPGESEPSFSLAHSILAEPAREISAPAREAARRTFELLGSKAENGERLDIREWFQLRREGIAPSTQEEAAVVEQSKRFFYIVLGAIGAVPLVLIILIYIAISGHFYLDTGRPAGGGKQTVVVRKGRPGLSAFFWLPASPGYGEIIADTGFTRAMVGESTWKEIADSDVSGSNEGMAYVDAALASLEPRLAAEVRYATTGDEADLATIFEGVTDPKERVRLLSRLAPIARGNAQELSLLDESLTAEEPSVRTAALAVIASGAERNPEAFSDALARTLAAQDTELRRLAVAAVRGLPPAEGTKIVAKAVGLSRDAETRRDLLAFGKQDGQQGPSASAAAAQLRDKSTSRPSRERARNELSRAFKTDPGAAVAAASALAGDAEAPPEERVFALEAIFELAPEDSFAELKEVAEAAKSSKSEPVEAAALPLFARTNPEAAAGDLALLVERKLSPELRKATALAWGEVAKSDRRAAITALEPMIADPSPKVRAAAARAFGNTGRASQTKLIKMVKTQRFDVALGAAYGLANSAKVGASSSVAVGGIYSLWKRKGKPRRRAAEVYAKLARSKPGAVFNYLSAAARARDDVRLHPIGAAGLCNAYGSGHKRAARELARTAGDESVEVRRLVIQCLVDSKKALGKVEQGIAIRLGRDSDAAIRADAARVLSRVAADSNSKGVKKALAKLASDKSREPRMLAIRALGRLGSGAPAAAMAALPAAFRGAPEPDKLEVLRTARALGASEVVGRAITDDSAAVRIAAIDTAIGIGADVASVVNSALADPALPVRRAALERLADGKSGLSDDEMQAALRVAIRDDNEAIGDLALATLARVGDAEAARVELERRLEAPSERVRAQAARASIGLAESDAKSAIELLGPLQDDPSHDVRVALVQSLGKAMALAMTPSELAKRLSQAEARATHRWVAVGALLTLAQTEAGAAAARDELGKVTSDGPPLARHAAALGLGLLESRADGLAFLQTLVP